MHARKEIPNFDIALLETQIYGLQIGVLLLLQLESVRCFVRRLLRLPKEKRGKLKSAASDS